MRTLVHACLLAVATWGVQGATILDENFQGATEGFYAGAGTVITGSQFQVLTGNVDVAGPADYGWLCTAPAVGKCLDTQGSGSNRGSIESINVINLFPGITYTLQFALVRWNDTPPGGAGQQDSVVRVSLGTAFSESFTVDGTWVDQVVVRNFTVNAPTSGRLTFADGGGSAAYAGAILDNVSLTNNVPEPATFGLAGLALMAAGLTRRRR